MAMFYLAWIFICPTLWIPCGCNTIPGKLGLMWTECQVEFVAVVVAIHRVVHGLCTTPGRRCSSLCRWYGLEPSWWRILHTRVCAVPVILEILCILVHGLHCTASRTLRSPHHCCSRSAVARGNEPVCFRILCMVSNVLWCGVLWCG